jgi:hypothetical protein
VEGVITATPSEVAVGRIKPGTKVERKVVLRGPKPFKVIQVDGSDEQFKVAGKFTEAKMVHVLSITMEAGKEIQELSHRFHVLTDLGDDAVVDFTLQAQVAP